MAHDVFISYPHQDKTVADAACTKLETQGIRCWMAPRDIAPGADWAESIVEAIDGCRVMIIIFSAHTNQSKQVGREVQQAFDGEKPVVPLRIENVTPKGSFRYYMGSVHWLDALTPPLEDHLERLAISVRALVKITPPDSESDADDLNEQMRRDALARRLSERSAPEEATQFRHEEVNAMRCVEADATQRTTAEGAGKRESEVEQQQAAAGRHREATPVERHAEQEVARREEQQREADEKRRKEAAEDERARAAEARQRAEAVERSRREAEEERHQNQRTKATEPFEAPPKIPDGIWVVVR
jgi:hypothetical protein